MLRHTGGNKREAADRLGISYKAILYKIREFGIGRPRNRRPTAGSDGGRGRRDADAPGRRIPNRPRSTRSRSRPTTATLGLVG